MKTADVTRVRGAVHRAADQHSGESKGYEVRGQVSKLGVFVRLPSAFVFNTSNLKHNPGNGVGFPSVTHRLLLFFLFTQC